ncbi:MAG: TonB family protein [Bryobacteraceae bacterium]|jgi:TonB family protein
MRKIARVAAVAALAAALAGCRAHNLRRAEAAMARGDYESAELLLERVLQRSPQDAEAHLLSGKAKLLRGRLEGGAEELEVAAQLDPGLKARIARVYFDAGTRLEFGRMYFQKAIQHDPHIAPQISAWALKAAQSQADAQQWTKALETAQTAIEADPGSRSRFGSLFLAGATANLAQDPRLASEYTAQTCSAGLEYVKPAAQMLSTMKSTGFTYFTGYQEARRCLCGALGGNPTLAREDDDFAWLAYGELFDGPGEYLKLFPNGRHATQAREAVRRARRAMLQPGCTAVPAPSTAVPAPSTVQSAPSRTPASAAGRSPASAPGRTAGGALSRPIAEAPRRAIPPPPPPPPPEGPQRHPRPVGRIKVDDTINQGKLIRHVAPAYPEVARRAGIEGTVRLSVLIGVDGKVKQVRVLSGHPMLAVAAEEAVWQWLYQPALVQGEPVEVRPEIHVNFRLSQ